MFEKLKQYNNLYTKQERKELIGKILTELRKKAGLQQKEVAELLSVEYQTYRNYENASSEPPAEILVRLSKLYDVPVDFIVGADDYSKNKELENQIIKECQEQIEALKAEIENETDEAKKIAKRTILQYAEEQLKDRIKKAKEQA